jgi:hypothetical protein
MSDDGGEEDATVMWSSKIIIMLNTFYGALFSTNSYKNQNKYTKFLVIIIATVAQRATACNQYATDGEG